MPIKNPGPETHQQNGLRHLSKGAQYWKIYYEGGSIADFIQAYEHLILAHEEFTYSKDKVGKRQAKKGIDAARKEIRLMHKLSKA